MDVEIFLAKLVAGDRYSIALCITGMCIVGCVYSLIFQYRVWKWPSVWGELFEADVQKLGGTDLNRTDQEYSAHVGYRYTVKGQVFTGKRLSGMTVIASHNARAILQKQLSGVETQGGKVRVYYNPSRPAKSFLIRGSWYQIVFTLLMLALMVAAFWRLMQM